MKQTIVENPVSFFNNAGNGNGAPMLVNGKLVPNANQTLRHEEHVRYDEALLHVATERMRATQDLRSRGLIRPIGGIGVILSMYERAGEMTDAAVSMDGRTRNEKDRLTFDEVGVPIPIFHKEWELGHRQLEASRTRGEPLDTMQVEIAGRIVTEKIETHIFNGLPGLVVDGKQVYGYRTHPDRNTYSLVGDWTLGTAGAAIVADVQAMIQIQLNDLMYGPFMLYYGKDFHTALTSDYSASKGDNTILDRIKALPEIADAQMAAFLDPDEVILIQMTSDVVDLATAVDLRNIQWQQQPFSTDYMTYAMLAIRVKSEKNGRSGICHGT